MSLRFWITAVAVLASCQAMAETLPSTAKKATVDELRALSDKKKVAVEIFDLGTPVRGNLIWNWQKKAITGTAVINNKDKIRVRSILTTSGEKVCATNKGEKPSCHAVYIDGSKFYEVNDDGSVHAVSEVEG